MDNFYDFYLSQHSNRTCRRLHFFGTLSAIIALCFIFYMGAWKYLYTPFIFGYLPAWIGHFFFEKNKPATFKYPVKSLKSDFRMFYEMATGKIPW